MLRSRSLRPAPRRFGIVARLAVVLAAGAMVITSCSSSPQAIVTVTQTAQPTGASTPVVTVPSATGDAPAETTAAQTSSSAANAARVTSTPAFGSTDIAPNVPIALTAFHATLAQVTMSGSDGSTVTGEIKDGTSWSNTQDLKYGVTYTVSGQFVGSDGAQQPFEGTVATVKPASTIQAAIQIPEGAKVGVAAPVVLTFLKAVANKVGIKDRLHVTANGQEVEGAWVWMQDEDVMGNGTKWSRVHFRPKDFWAANAKIEVKADLYGVNYGSGWGRENIDRTFQTGAKLVVQANVDSHRLLVIENDKVIKNYPVSFGLPSTKDPGRTTVSGIHIVQEKKPGEFEMCNKKYNYCGVKEYWGVRINNNGEFIHVNKQTEASGLLGKRNVSHGCINIGMKDGEEFFNMVYYGVPVIVENTGVPMTEKDYLWDWSKSWTEWKALSERV